MAKYFSIPFAMNGDRKEIPTDKQDDGSISFDEGYGADYEKNKQVDPTAKDISRQEFNSVLHDITEAIGEIQRSGVASWTNEISYNKGATIIHNGAVYTSTINANKNEPPHASWSSFDLSAYRKLDNNVFDGVMQIRAADGMDGTGIFLCEGEGRPRGQMVANSYGLQFAQVQDDGSAQTFTFPRRGDGGEIMLDKNISQVWGEDPNNTLSQRKISYAFNNVYNDSYLNGSVKYQLTPSLVEGNLLRRTAIQGLVIEEDRILALRTYSGSFTDKNETVCFTTFNKGYAQNEEIKTSVSTNLVGHQSLAKMNDKYLSNVGSSTQNRIGRDFAVFGLDYDLNVIDHSVITLFEDTFRNDIGTICYDEQSDEIIATSVGKTSSTPVVRIFKRDAVTQGAVAPHTEFNVRYFQGVPIQSIYSDGKYIYILRGYASGIRNGILLVYTKQGVLVYTDESFKISMKQAKQIASKTGAVALYEPQVILGDGEGGLLSLCVNGALSRETGFLNSVSSFHISGIERNEPLEFVGSGKVMREGAYGIGLTHITRDIDLNDVSKIPEGFSYAYTVRAANRPIANDGTVLTMFNDNRNFGTYIYSATSGRTFIRKVIAGEIKDWQELYSEINTRTDKNGVLHKGTTTPLDTLNTSDMSQEVVDRDDITVTSGAVYRESQKLSSDLEKWKAATDKPSVRQEGLGNFNKPSYMLEMKSGGAQQSVCFDTVNRHIYTSHTASLNGQVINRFDMDTGVHTPLTHVGLQDKRLGHSGLGITYSEDGSPILWTSLNKDYSEGRAAIVSFKPKMEARTDNVDSIDATPNHFEFTEYTLFEGGWRNLNPAISKCGRFVTVFHSNLPATNIHTFRTWAIKDLVAGGDNTQNYLYSFEVPHYTADSKGINFQGMASDGKYVYIVGGGYNADYEAHKDEPTFRFHIYTLDGELVHYDLDVKLGLKDMLEPPLTGEAIREVEGISFLGEQLHVLISGSRTPTGRRQYLYKLGSDAVMRSKLGLDTTTLKGADVYRAKVSNKITYSFVDINYLPEDGAYLTDNVIRVQGERMLSLATRFDRNINGKPYGRLVISSIDEDGNFDRRWALLGSGDFVPANTGQVSIGAQKSTLRDLYLLNNPTVTSDERAKFDIEDIDEKYMRVMSRLKFKQFKLKIGTSGRTHFGVIAQEWIAACEAEGVDPKESGVLVGDETTGYAIRYNELQILHNAYVLWRLDNLYV